MTEKFIKEFISTIPMKPKARGPPKNSHTPNWKKSTPSTSETVLPRWQARYTELRELDYSRCDAIAQIAKEENLHFNTVYRHMTPQVNQRQKKYQKGRWQKEKSNPQKREQVISYKGKYQILRRNIQDYVVAAFSHSDTPQTMDEISDSIREQTSISISPTSLEGLCQKVETRTGQPLLIPDSSKPPVYRLGAGYKA